MKQWNKAVGDTVQQDEEIATIETDKVGLLDDFTHTKGVEFQLMGQIDVSVNAPFSGKITEFLANEDDTVAVGQGLLRMEKGEGKGGGNEGDSAPKAAPEGGARSEPKDLGEGNKDDVAPGGEKLKGAPEDTHAKQAEKAPAMEDSEHQKPAQRVDEGDKSKPAPKKEEAPKPAPKQESKPVKKEESKPAKKEEGASGPKSVGTRNETRVNYTWFDRESSADTTQIKMSRMRQTIAQRLKASQNAAASLTTFNEIDMSSIMDFRSLYKDGVLKNEGVKLGFMSAFARASVLALREIPAANASIEGDTIVYRDYVDLSVAVSTPKGLVTPVVRNAEGMGLVDIEKAIAELGKRVRSDFLSWGT